eukprot:TRINITY_DN7956_c0_g1_i1.p2 TRINITY_DN7956_c0_g1~~TRINITY_DN7956_c0_g1_i1.p2  ORF type:complete len:117 (-),score=24.76 TRINITY_DN7956_c0_g1_i1:26-376(-)
MILCSNFDSCCSFQFFKIFFLLAGVLIFRDDQSSSPDSIFCQIILITGLCSLFIYAFVGSLARNLKEIKAESAKFSVVKKDESTGGVRLSEEWFEHHPNTTMTISPFVQVPSQVYR